MGVQFPQPKQIKNFIMALQKNKGAVKDFKRQTRIILGEHVTDKNLIENGTKPVHERYYYGSKLSKDISCYDEVKKKYINTELFSPVLYDYEQQIPKYEKRWEVYNGKGKDKKIIKINYPQSYIQYWETQRQRCLNGYTVGGVYITGMNYFFLNFWSIKSKTAGRGNIRPQFMDLHKEAFDLIYQAQEEGKNICFLKRRQAGFSEMMASICGYCYTFYESSHSLIVAGQETYSEETMKRCINGLDNLSASAANAGKEFYKRRIKDRPEDIISGYFGSDGVPRGYRSQISMFTLKVSAEAVSGKTPVVTLMEESGLNHNLRAGYYKILPAIEERGVQDGRIIIVLGTGGFMEVSVDQLKDMFYNPENYNMLSVPSTEPNGKPTSPFFSGTYYYAMDNDGNSYHEISKILIEEARLKLNGDEKNLKDHKVAYPLLPKDAFSSSDTYLFNSQLLNQRINELYSIGAQNSIMRGRFEWIYQGNKKIGVEFIPAPKGKEYDLDSDGDKLYPFVITELPEMTGEQTNPYIRLFSDIQIAYLYGAGTDSYDRPNAPTSSSLGSCAIKKSFLNADTTSNNFVARILDRPITPNKFFEYTAQLCCFYHCCLNLIEYSNISIFDWYINNGFEYLLKLKPVTAASQLINSKAANKYGIDPSTKTFWENLFIDYIEHNCDKLDDIEMCEKFAVYRRTINGKKFNCDLSISCFLAHLNIHDSTETGFTPTTKKAAKSNGWNDFIYSKKITKKYAPKFL